MINSKLLQEASQVECELRDIASREKVQYKRQVMAQAARVLRDLINYDEDEISSGNTDDF